MVGGLQLTHSDYARIVGHARACLPEEACGLIAGSVPDEGGAATVRQVYLLENVDHTNEHFSMAPEEQLAAVKDMRAHGWEPLGNWHSHPETPSRPSEEDKRLANDPQAAYLILSLMHADAPVLNAFCVSREKQVGRIPLFFVEG